jgi:RNA polymerase sigma factor (sigma-70 family)
VAVDLPDQYLRNRLAVARWLRTMGIPRRDIPDLVHDVFVVVIQRHRSYQARSTFRTWVFAITRFTAARYIRGCVRSRSFKSIDITPRTDDTGDAEIRVRLVHEVLLRRVSRRACAILTLDLDERTANEATSALGVSVMSLSTLRRRSRAELVEQIQRLPRPVRDLLKSRS